MIVIYEKVVNEVEREEEVEEVEVVVVVVIMTSVMCRVTL